MRTILEAWEKSELWLYWLGECTLTLGFVGVRLLAMYAAFRILRAAWRGFTNKEKAATTETEADAMRRRAFEDAKIRRDLALSRRLLHNVTPFVRDTTDKVD